MRSSSPKAGGPAPTAGPVRWAALAALVVLLPPAGITRGEPGPLREGWDYVEPSRAVASRFEGRPGVVLHVGDSITYANPYGQWARAGAGQDDDDRAALLWMHAGAGDDRDGWHLASADHPDGGRSFTAAGGLRADELLAGGKQGLPSLVAMLETYRPQVVVLMIGTNDASAGRSVEAYRGDVEAAVTAMHDRGIVAILSTIPPHPHQEALARSYNEALRNLARRRGMPMIDFERAILSRRPDDWNGTLLSRDDVHPTAARAGVSPTSAPTPENLRECGYLLRGWLSVRAIAEVTRSVLDAEPPLEAGKIVRLPISRDTWFSEVGPEADGNCGGSPRLKVKSYQEMSFIDVDPSPLRGRVVESATLHVRLAGPERLHRLTVGTVGAEWVEGTASNYEPQAGSSTFRRRRHPEVLWAGPGSDLCSIILGQGGTTWRMADASPPDDRGWQAVAVDPLIVAARVAGVSEGFLAFDDTGSEWTREGDRFKLDLNPNRFLHSRESGADNAPYLSVTLGPEDMAPPGAPGDVRSGTDGLPQGEAWVSWTTPADIGPAGTVGFFVTIDGRDVPRYLIPLAGAPGERVRMRLRDLGLRPDVKVAVEVRAVDGAGHRGEGATAVVQTSRGIPSKPIRPATGPKREPLAGLPKLAGAEVAILDELDKVHPVSGAVIPAPTSPDYWTGNHLWSAASRRVRLHAARNEFVGFQVVLRGPVRKVRAGLAFDGPGPDRIKVSLGRPRFVPTSAGPLPDPVVPLDGPFAVPSPDDRVEGQTCGSILAEVYVPHDVAPGEHRGRLVLEAEGGSLALDVALRVRDFTLPDALSFLPEMNCYGLPRDETAYYRLAHEHRTVLNRVPYSQNGTVAEGCAPGWDGETLDWSAWDRRFGPLLDGSAFADLPRKGVPLEVFYLPLHENWPTPIEGNYDGGYWADRAFTAPYRRAFVEASRQIAEHVDKQGWNATMFQGFLNNKNNFKAEGWSRGSSPWLLDEPAGFQDFWALRFFGEAFHEGVRRADPRGAKLVFRADISRPQWQRDALDGLLDYLVVGGTMREYRRIVLDRKADQGQIVLEYGSSNAIEEANVQPAAWCIDAWTLGADGVVPWQTVGIADSWSKADPLALLYPGTARDGPGPAPSLRLKSFRRGEQDVEYLTLLSLVRGEPRESIGLRVREALKLSGERTGSGFIGGEDAGRIQFARLSPRDLWGVRVAVGEEIEAAHPAPSRRLIEFRTPPRDTSRLPSRYVAGEEPIKREEPRSVPPGRLVTRDLRGRDAVRDALIDPSRPDEPLGAVARDNAVSRNQATGAFLVRFDLDRLDLPPGARIARAFATFSVWDPSSTGRTLVGAFPIRSHWDEGQVTWRRATAAEPWSGDGFDPSADAGPIVGRVVVEPDRGDDVADPPIRYRVEITDAVRAWLAGRIPNHGIALVPIPDRSIDDGHFTRFQVVASEMGDAATAPSLTVLIEP